MSSPSSRLVFVSLTIFTALALQFQTGRRENLRREIFERAAASLRPETHEQLAQAESAGRRLDHPTEIFASLLKAPRANTLAVALFDVAGNALHAVGATSLPAQLPSEDLAQLLSGESISRYHAGFSVDHSVSNTAGPVTLRQLPALEVVLPLHGSDPARLLGFAQYYFDARTLALEVEALDNRIFRQTMIALTIGVIIAGGVIVIVSRRMGRAQRARAESDAYLAHDNFVLSLATKDAALDKIASELTRAPVGSSVGAVAAAGHHNGYGAVADDWVVLGNMDRLESLISEADAFSPDSIPHAAFTGHEIADIVRQRATAAALDKGVIFSVSGGFDRKLDSHRAGLVCLIASTLIQNAVDATDAGKRVAVILRNGGSHATIRVSDDGRGVRDEIRAHLFEPGCTTRPGANGLGLAISQLLARQLSATLVLDSTGPEGTTFRLTFPLDE